MSIAICPGSFDPVTKGHLDIIQRTAKLFDRIIVVVLTNPKKNATFTVEQRKEMLRLSTTQLPNVEIDSYDGLLADYARIQQASVIVKGLRAMSDFEYEFQMALTNKALSSEVETVFLTTSSENMFLSSSLIKQVSSLGGDISSFVPEPVADMITQALNPDAKKPSNKV